jgi:hypothetical protein
MNIADHIFESLETIFWVKILFDTDSDPGSGNLFDPGSVPHSVRANQTLPGTCANRGIKFIVPQAFPDKKEMKIFLIYKGHSDGSGCKVI